MHRILVAVVLHTAKANKEVSLVFGNWMERRVFSFRVFTARASMGFTPAVRPCLGTYRHTHPQKQDMHCQTRASNPARASTQHSLMHLMGDHKQPLAHVSIQDDVYCKDPRQ